jgi:hypothetical protein
MTSRLHGVVKQGGVEDKGTERWYCSLVGTRRISAQAFTGLVGDCGDGCNTMTLGDGSILLTRSLTRLALARVRV